MSIFRVTISRKITTSAVFDVKADNEKEARDKGIKMAWSSEEEDWKPDEVDLNDSEPYITGVSKSPES